MADQGVRKIDRRRRERVIEGALEAIYQYGVEGMTHRRVAAAAEVSVGATTYYFETLEDLLEAAMRHAAERDIAALRDRFGDPSHPADIADVLTSYVFDAGTVDRHEAVIVSELAVAALRREHLREIGEAWHTTWIEVLSPSLGDAAEVASAAIGGLIQRVLLSDGEISREQVRQQIELVLELGR